MADTGVFSTMINLTWSLWTQTSLTKLHFIPHWIHKIAVHIIRSYSPMLSTMFDRISALGKMGMGERPGKEIGKQFKSLQFAIFCYSLHIPVIQFKFPMKVPVKVTLNYSGNSCFIIFRIEKQEFLFLWGYTTRLWRKHMAISYWIEKKWFCQNCLFCTYWNNKLLQSFTANENIYFPDEHS